MSVQKNDEFIAKTKKAKKDLLKFEALVTAADEIGVETAGTGMESMAITNNYLGAYFLHEIGQKIDKMNDNVKKLMQILRNNV